MPKPIQPPAPAYGSPEWKAERARMVGTPEWKAANNYSASEGGGMRLSVQQPQYIRFNPGTTVQNAGATGTKVYSDGRELAPGQQVATMPNTTPQLPPATTPQNPLVKPAGATPITLPDMFQQNYNMQGPQQQAAQGIKMPNIQKPLQNFGGGSNWTDFLTVAYNQNLR